MSAVLAAVLAFFAAALLLYVVLAGADFGAGILEIFGSRAERHAQRSVISHAMAPVWEANHVWLVLAVVILFVAFPQVYTCLTVALHLPISAILLGIFGRGCAFTFRHYDVFEQRTHARYSRIFAATSLWTAFFVGVVAGACALGRIDPSATSYFDLYVGPWCNLYCAAVGALMCCLCAFVAAAFLLGETQDSSLRAYFAGRAKASAALMVALGAVVFAVAELQGLHLLKSFLANRYSMVCFGVATLLWVPLLSSLRRSPRQWPARLLAATLVSLVVLGFFAVQYPVAVRLLPRPGQTSLTFVTAAAPPVTLRCLLVALVVGSTLIFPALAYLFGVFKWQAPAPLDLHT